MIDADLYCRMCNYGWERCWKIQGHQPRRACSYCRSDIPIGEFYFAKDTLMFCCDPCATDGAPFVPIFDVTDSEWFRDLDEDRRKIY